MPKEPWNTTNNPLIGQNTLFNRPENMSPILPFILVTNFHRSILVPHHWIKSIKVIVNLNNQTHRIYGHQ